MAMTPRLIEDTLFKCEFLQELDHLHLARHLLRLVKYRQRQISTTHISFAFFFSGYFLTGIRNNTFSGGGDFSGEECWDGGETGCCGTASEGSGEAGMLGIEERDCKPR
jgi:hypothetical protein